ncbi:MAG: HAMP domain-containing sensor histidine kinase, partial [Syntrophales bacterium]|nr:HAMP domain-containing sensor histidine kinase [Syntrophales bacterium]
STNINSILNLARIESRLQKGKPEPVDLVETIDRFIDENRHIFHDCDIRVHRPTGNPLIYPVITSLFEILLMNVLINARKYNSSGRPQIDITFERNHASLLIRFRDNGIGIPRTELKRIFRKFHQAPQQDAVPAGGSGIGLYLVQQIARLHRGKVVADSEGVGKGSVVTLILPEKETKGDKNESR